MSFGFKLPWQGEKRTTTVDGRLYEWFGSKPASERGNYPSPQFYIEGPRTLLDFPRDPDWIEVWRLVD